MDKCPTSEPGCTRIYLPPWRPTMKFKSVSLALVIATASLFGDHSFKMPVKDGCLEADIIVMGVGASGCVLMNQLSEHGRFSVLGIEAGPNLTGDPAIEAVGLPALLLPATAA